MSVRISKSMSSQGTIFQFPQRIFSSLPRSQLLSRHATPLTVAWRSRKWLLGRPDPLWLELQLYYPPTFEKIKPSELIMWSKKLKTWCRCVCIASSLKSPFCITTPRCLILHFCTLGRVGFSIYPTNQTQWKDTTHNLPGTIQSWLPWRLVTTRNRRAQFRVVHENA